MELLVMLWRECCGGLCLRREFGWREGAARWECEEQGTVGKQAVFLRCKTEVAIDVDLRSNDGQEGPRGRWWQEANV